MDARDRRQDEPPLRFPCVEADRDSWPAKPVCGWCGAKDVCEPNSMAILRGESSLSITWHGAHAVPVAADGAEVRWHEGTGPDPDVYTCVDLASEVEAGTFQLHYCTTACLRAHLNAWVDRLEHDVSEAGPR